MAEVLALAVAFPSVVFTVLLGVVLVYWLFVVAGAVNLGDGADGAVEGAAKGVLEGAAKGALEGAAKGVLEGSVDGHGGDVGDIDGGEAGVLAALMSALHLGKVPVTVVVSLLVTFSWLCSMVYMQLVTRLLGGPSTVLSGVGLVLSPILALPLTALATRPLARIFVERRAPTRVDLIGKVCVVRTGKVTPTFGEGMLEDGGAGLVLRVRVDGEAELKRGQHALIVEWDDEREAFVVEPMDALVAETKRQ